jgi:hypothetical protein
MSVYSFVNAPTLVRDLARHDRGGAVATDLLRALTLTADDLADLDLLRVAPTAPARRAEVLTRLRAMPGALTVLAAARDVAGTTGMEAWTAAVDVLDAAAIGSVDDLLRFVRHDVLDQAWTGGQALALARHPGALDVVADGVLATYAADGVAELARPLGRPWRRWLAQRRVGVPAVDAPVADIVTDIRATSPQRLSVAADELRRQRSAGWSWPAAMHDACWAVHLTGRERLAARAQLHALRAVLGVTGARPRPDLVAAVVAAVHATVVADVLDAPAVAAMTAPLHVAVG